MGLYRFLQFSPHGLHLIGGELVGAAWWALGAFLPLIPWQGSGAKVRHQVGVAFHRCLDFGVFDDAVSSVHFGQAVGVLLDHVSGFING